VDKKVIAYITETSPGNKHAWSGTAHYVFNALKNSDFTVIALGPARPGFIRIILAALNKLSLFIFRKRIDFRHSKIYSKSFSKIFNNKLEQIKYDAIVVCGPTECGAYLITKKPIFYVLDRTVAGAINYHTILTDLWYFSMTESVFTDKKAMEESSLLFFSSHWAAEHARLLYRIPSNKIKVVPFGANLDKIPDRVTALTPKSTERWKLLLIGTYWENKGADIAYSALLHLLEKNVNAELTVVGCEPAERISHERLTIVPFVDKNSNDGIKKIWELYLSHHFFILPTRFDCTPIVFCEASAFGLPILSANTGGVGGHVKENINGFLIPFEDKGEGYAKKIIEVISEKGSYSKLCASSRDHYESELNWEHWANTFKKETQNLF